MKKILNKIGLGKLVYLFVALKQLLFLKPSSMTLLMDDNKKEEFSKVYFTAVMNQKYEAVDSNSVPMPVLPTAIWM